MITYDEFSNVHIGLGKILAAQPLQGADKLLVLSVDVGEEQPRQIVSGIRPFVADPQALVGQTFPFVLNLAYRTIRGVESQGMILAASTPDGGFAFLKPDPALPPGTRIK